MGQRPFQTIFANSPFLSHCLIADIGLLAAVLNLGPGGVLKNVLGTVKSTAADAGDQADLMRSLRVCRRRAAFAVAFADFAGLISAGGRVGEECGSTCRSWGWPIH